MYLSLVDHLSQLRHGFFTTDWYPKATGKKDRRLKRLKKLTAAGLVLCALLVVSAWAWAAPSSEQLQELDALQGKMNELRKEMIDLKLEAGIITEDQASSMSGRIDAPKENALTPQQKQVLVDLHKKQVALRKEGIAALTEAGLLTKERAKSLLARVERQAAYRQRMGVSARPQMNIRGRQPLGQQGRLRIGATRSRMGAFGRGQRLDPRFGRGFRGLLPLKYK